MANLLSMILGMFFFALIVDYVFKEGGVEAWRKASEQWWDSLGQVKFKEIIVAANRWFLELFDAIYGDKFWSWKRIYRSVLSSYFAVAILFAITGTAALDLPAAIGDVWFLVMMIATILNLLPDFISLQETRWIMRLSLRKESVYLPLWLAIDLVLTVVIFQVGFFLFFIVLLIDEGTLPSTFHWSQLFVLGPNPGRDVLLVPFLSTFFTSFLWFLFLFTALLIGVCQRLSPFLRMLLKVVAQSEKPARTTAGFLAVGLLSGYGLYRVVSFAATLL